LNKRPGDQESASSPASGQKLKKADYERELERLQIELVKLQRWVVHEKKKICIVFEGAGRGRKRRRDQAIMERVSPRIFRVIALPAPTERKKSQMYIQRYLPHFPARRIYLAALRSDGLLPPSEIPILLDLMMQRSDMLSFDCIRELSSLAGGNSPPAKAAKIDESQVMRTLASKLVK
jgi:hypothetical protein